MTKRKGITAAEFLAQLQADPEWMAAKAQRDEEHRKEAEALKLAEAPLVDELRAAGFSVSSVWDLVNSPGSYSDAVPILLSHLERPYPPAIRDGIARALAVPETKTAGWDRIVRLFREEPEGRAKQGLAVAVANAADGQVMEDVIGMLRDRELGDDRVLLLSAIRRWRDPRAEEVLKELEADPALKQEVEVILRRFGKRKRR